MKYYAYWLKRDPSVIVFLLKYDKDKVLSDKNFEQYTLRNNPACLTIIRH